MTVSVALTFPTYQSAIDALLKLQATTPAEAEVIEAGKAAAPAEPNKRATEYPTFAGTAPAPIEQSTKRRGRPPKAEQINPAPTVTPVPTPAPAKLIEKEEALAKFKALHDANGMAVCRAVLTRLGAQRFADVSQALYPDLVDLCDRAIGGEDSTKAIE